MPNVPVGSTGVSLAQNIYGSIAGDDRAEAAKAIPAEIGSLGLEALFALKDPVFALTSAGLEMVLYLVEPLQNLLDMVGGSPSDMERTEQAWGEVATALENLSGSTGSAISSNFTDWQGNDANDAHEMLDALEASIAAVAHEASSIQRLVSWCKMLAEVIAAVIKSFIAELVSWLITKGLIALLNSKWTFGASIAAFLMTGVYKASSVFARAMHKLENAKGIFGEIGKLLVKYVLNRKGPFEVGMKKGTQSGTTFALQAFGLRDGGNYQLWKGLLGKMGVAAGTAAAGDATTTLTNQFSGASEPDTSLGSDGGIVVNLDELDGLQSAISGLSSEAEPIHALASETMADEMTWGIPGWMGLESKYTSACEGLDDAISDIQRAFEGNAIRIGDCRDQHAACDEEQAAALNTILDRFNL